MHPDFKTYLLTTTGASKAKEIEMIQSLWSGYGKISRFRLQGASLDTVVIKHISLNRPGGHPRGWNTSFSHRRKVKSYQVETHWYEHWSQDCGEACRIPRFIGSYLEGDDQWIVLEDLNPDFPARKHHLNLPEVKVCLSWLAEFHMRFLNRTPTGLWNIGTYWNLKTRPDEFEQIEHPLLKSKAHAIDELLNRCKFMTIVHGDAKVANFCFSEDGHKVAAVDFQYVGGGCGMKDVAYFLGSCLSGAECTAYENELLDFYFSRLEHSFRKYSFDFLFDELEEEWRKMYPVACTDFIRFISGWMPGHQKINDYNLRMMDSVLGGLT